MKLYTVYIQQGIYMKYTFSILILYHFVQTNIYQIYTLTFAYIIKLLHYETIILLGARHESQRGLERYETKG
jgi:hypothetical protein